ncbi:MAG: hypothetical protein QOH19_85 [Actinomycetota bacterium]|jgi:fructosamine-3-kinase|nr:hypothetical protein [Actinomycetota bacterium]
MPPEATLWTIAATLGAAFFTSVLAQYLFAPWLEARKEGLVAQYKEQTDFARRLNSLALGSLYQGDEEFAKATSRMRHPSAYVGARGKDALLFTECVWMASSRLSASEARDEKAVAFIHDTLTLAASIAQPFRSPWLRPWRRYWLRQRIGKAKRRDAKRAAKATVRD